MAPAIALVPHTEGFSEPIVTQIAAEDKVKWYKKPNLRFMYFCLFACCMGVEMTSGFDSQLINTLQFSGPWNARGIFPPLLLIATLNSSRFLRGK
jgi:NADH:ubiquinone oxidoreductase subunit B-like Fe-S oxidoreductase